MGLTRYIKWQKKKNQKTFKKLISDTSNSGKWLIYIDWSNMYTQITYILSFKPNNIPVKNKYSDEETEVQSVQVVCPGYKASLITNHITPADQP